MLTSSGSGYYKWSQNSEVWHEIFNPRFLSCSGIHPIEAISIFYKKISEIFTTLCLSPVSTTISYSPVCISNKLSPVLLLPALNICRWLCLVPDFLHFHDTAISEAKFMKAVLRDLPLMECSLRPDLWILNPSARLHLFVSSTFIVDFLSTSVSQNARYTHIDFWSLK